MKRIFFTIAVAAVIAFAPAGVQANPLAPGGVLGPPIPSGTLNGTIEQTTNQLFSYGTGASEVTGYLRQAVVQEAGGTLDFVYQITVNTTGTGSNGTVSAFSVNGYSSTGNNLDVSQVSNTSGLTDPNHINGLVSPGTSAMQLVTRSNGTGDILTFGTGPLGAGAVSYLAVVKTNFTSTAGATGFGVIGDGMNSATVFGLFIPAVAPHVPEPTTMVLWGGSFLGLTCVGAWRRRKTAIAQA